MLLEDHIKSNKRKSLFLLIFIPAILFVLVYVIGEFFFGGNNVIAWAIGIFVVIIYTLSSYFYSDDMILKVVKAKEADPEKHKKLYDLVEGLCLGAGVPMPKIYIQKNENINAFATGRNPKDGKICVTTGALEKLNKDELEGVLAHELSHIKNYDVMFMTLVVAMVGSISLLAGIFWRGTFFGVGNRDRKMEGQAGLVLFFVGIAFAILAPLFAKLVQLAISRKREFLADASAAHITRYPEGLASALEKIKMETKPMKVEQAIAPLYFSDPFKRKIQGLFATHPPIEKRIEALRSMK